MLYLQATKKTLRRLGVGNMEFADAGATESALGNWFVNVVSLGAREAFLFMSTRSLLSFPILIGKKAPGPQDMPDFLAHGLALLTNEMKTPTSQAKQLIDGFDTVALCAANDRSIVGSHNAIAAEYAQRIDDAGGLTAANLDKIVGAANTTPRAALKWRTSYEVSIELLAAGVA